MFRLKKIQIDGYKNLTGDYDFSSNKGYISLIGLNGSGKSNLLEAISIIFDGLINNGGAGIPFDYEIEYGLNDHIYTRKKRQAMKDGIICKAEEIEYPSSLIACYSGEDLRLWQIAYEKYHMGYFNEAVKQIYSSPTFLYINKYCWKIALVSLLCSNNKKVKDFLKNTLKIDSPSDVELDLSYDDTKKDGFQTHAALNWFDRIVQDGNQNINLNIIATTDIYIAGRQVSEEYKAKYVFNFLYLLSQPKKNAKNKIDKLIDDIKINVNIENRRISFDDLSEGEKKLILIECITKVLGDENSLVLLDEPDAHTHIAMKKNLLKLISEFEGQTIMTTHSPMFLNKRWDEYKEENIFYMHDGKIEDTEPLKHLAELTENSIDYFEGSFILSSKKILVTEGPYDILYIKHAIDEFSDDNPNYLKIRDYVAFLHAGGSSNAADLYEQTLYPASEHYDNLVFLFDYDKAGFEGAEKVKESMRKKGDAKPKILFYQDDYSLVKTRKPIDKDSESYMAEDLFDSNSYLAVTNKVNVRNHKELRNINWNDVITSNKRPKSTPEAIKCYIEDNYASFRKEWLQNFKPVLNKLLDVFDLN